MIIHDDKPEVYSVRALSLFSCQTRLAASGTVVCGGADPIVEGSDLGVHGWECDGTAHDTPGGEAIDGAANGHGATRVTLGDGDMA
jgi:hypothetical protein